MKDLLKVIFVLMMIVSYTEACDAINSNDNCRAMTEPCEPIDLCVEPCDPISD